jgi:ribonuclease VapC
MIVVDSSVLVAVFKDEPEADALVTRLLAFQRRVISAATWFEASMVCLGRSEDPELGNVFDAIVATLRLDIVPLTADHAALARRAFYDYGKGRKKKASLNFGDCFAYALAKALDAPLLFKGEDFVHTDVKAA